MASSTNDDLEYTSEKSSSKRVRGVPLEDIRYTALAKCVR